MIRTTKGLMDESVLVKKVGEVNNENEHTNWIEYWFDDELVHRSVHVVLKKNVVAEAIAKWMNG